VENTNSRVLRWRLFLEDFNPILHYQPGPTNVVADGLSRAPILERQGSLAPSENAQFESLAFLPPVEHLPPHAQFPLDFTTLRTQQDQDPALAQLRQASPDQWQTVEYPTAADSQALWCHRTNPAAPWRIYLPTASRHQVLQWYHHVQGHPGIERMNKSLSQHFYAPSLKSIVANHVNACTVCQQHKLHGQGAGALPEKELSSNPWDDVAVDLAGPWTFQLNQRRKTVFHVLTCIDPLTNFFEIIPIDNTKSSHIAWKFEQEWLS
jgi:hypothetical protein